jgi:hypothetical protein
MSDPVLLAAEADDAMRVVIVPLTELLLLQRDAARGDDDAQYVARAASEVIQVVNNAPAYLPIRYTCCPQKMIVRGDSYRIGIVMPGVPGPTRGVAVIVCERCGNTPRRIDSAASKAMRRWRLAPDRAGGGGRT